MALAKDNVKKDWEKSSGKIITNASFIKEIDNIHYFMTDKCPAQRHLNAMRVASVWKMDCWPVFPLHYMHSHRQVFTEICDISTTAWDNGDGTGNRRFV